MPDAVHSAAVRHFTEGERQASLGNAQLATAHALLSVAATLGGSNQWAKPAWNEVLGRSPNPDPVDIPGVHVEAPDPTDLLGALQRSVDRARQHRKSGGGS